MSELTIEYRNVRRIDDDYPDRACDMASPDGGTCDHTADFTFEMWVNEDEKNPNVAACEGCFSVPDPSRPEQSFSETVRIGGD